MKLDQIRELAQKNQFTEFFKRLYRHCVGLLESMPEEELTRIFSINGLKSENRNFSSTGLIESITFRNCIEEIPYDIAIRHIDKINMLVDAWFKDRDDCEFYGDTINYCNFDSSFDFRHLTVKLFATRNLVYFERDLDDELYKVNISVEDNAFMEILCHQYFLKLIFGDYLVKFERPAGYENEGYYTGFYVSTKFFEN